MQVEALHNISADISSLLIRPLTLEDSGAMTIIEREVWDEEHLAPTDLIQRRLSANAGSSLGAFLVSGNILVGFVSAVCTHEDDIYPPKPWSHYASLALSPWRSHEVLYGIDLSVSDAAPRGTATLLMQSLFSHGKQLGSSKLFAVVRAPGFHAVSDRMSFNDYYCSLQSGENREPLYHLMCSAGLTSDGFVEKYYPDVQSADYGLAFYADLKNG